MANTLNSPTQGFQTFGNAEGSSPQVGLTPIWIASTDASLIFRGDAVITSTTGGTNNSGPYITAPTSGISQIRGVFQGCYQFSPAAGRVVWTNFYGGTVTGSTGDIKAYIIDFPDQQFIAQASTSGAITSSMIGSNIGMSITSSLGNQASGYSNATLLSSTVGSTNTLPWRLVDFYSAYAPPGIPAVGAGAFINGTDNTTAANIVVVRFNNCDRLQLTAKSAI